MSELGYRLFPRLYRDSVALMALASSLERLDGVIKVGAVMATPANVEILNDAEMLPLGLMAAPDDLVVAVSGEDAQSIERALGAAEAGLQSKDDAGETKEAARPRTLHEGLDQITAGIVAISVAGTYAPIVVEQALNSGLHVFCFSDNVDLDDEVRLKAKAASDGLLLMGPDCGTAMIDGLPLGFCNVLRRGGVAVVAASGTGAQEVSVLLDRAGLGISQMVGVGGRDLSQRVGAKMTLMALDLVGSDENTKLVVLVSKPPAPDIADDVLMKMGALGKPAVACLLGAADQDDTVPVRGTLESAAMLAAEMAGATLHITEPDITTAPVGGRVLGLYTGGTLASEAKVLLERAGVDAEVLDLGDDKYTAGRPHPMISPELRKDHIASVTDRPEVTVVLLDIVLGHGSHPDPAGEAVRAVEPMLSTVRSQGRTVHVLASVTGTPQDPQGFEAQRRIASAGGITVLDSNASAVRTAIRLVQGAQA